MRHDERPKIRKGIVLDEEVLMNLLMRWETSLERGEEISTRTLCERHPDLAEELERRIEILRGSIWLDEPLDPWDDMPPGSVLANRYRMEALIAEGGFSSVWKAYDANLQRFVALKFARSESSVGVDRIKREAYRTARMKHPSIITVHDLVRTKSASCLVMELMAGGSLADRQADSPLSKSAVVSCGQQIAQALDYAHRNGVVHRDVKPDNILLDENDVAKLADFGVASSSDAVNDHALMMTRRYAAPEQLAGGEASPQSDIYSLALVLVESLTGVVPDLGEGTGRDVLSELPDDLATLCRRALHPDPLQRCQSVLDLTKGLSELIEWR